MPIPQRGVCPVAKKVFLGNSESNQAAAGFIAANFGLVTGFKGLMRRREASINDVPIREADRLFRWPQGPRPADHPGLTELGL